MRAYVFVTVRTLCYERKMVSFGNIQLFVVGLEGDQKEYFLEGAKFF